MPSPRIILIREFCRNQFAPLLYASQLGDNLFAFPEGSFIEVFELCGMILAAKVTQVDFLDLRCQIGPIDHCLYEHANTMMWQFDRFHENQLGDISQSLAYE
jgi:hypothetical protein